MEVVAEVVVDGARRNIRRARHNIRHNTRLVVAVEGSQASQEADLVGSQADSHTPQEEEEEVGGDTR